MCPYLYCLEDVWSEKMIQKVVLTQGCPNGCAYCYEPKKEFKTFPMPKIIQREVQILDMNFLANPEHLAVLRALPKSNYELVCGFDFRRITPEIASLFKDKGFFKLRWAWDYGFSQQVRQKNCFKILRAAGFQPRSLSVFILINWKIPFVDCCKKLDLLKVWNVKVNDCCFDGGYRIAKPKDWTPEQIRRFRALSRWHNKLVGFYGDPEDGKGWDRFAFK